MRRVSELAVFTVSEELQRLQLTFTEGFCAISLYAGHDKRIRYSGKAQRCGRSMPNRFMAASALDDRRNLISSVAAARCDVRALVAAFISR